MNSEKTQVTTPSDREIVITRTFRAPRTLVWEAMTKPDLLKRWLLGPPGWSMTVCEEDPRVGGRFRYVWRGPDGKEMSMHGVYREVAPSERVSRTEAFSCGELQGEKLSTLVLMDLGNRTTATITMLFPSKAARDAALSFGAEPNWDKLDELLAASAA
jgi:uncharacterized protein YndB with AHSA1/START domain